MQGSSITLTAKAQYAIHALLQFEEGSNSPYLTTVELCQREQLSPGFMRRVLYALSRRTMVSSRVAIGGGFRLAAPARRITLLEIVEAVEGPTIVAVEPMHFDAIAARIVRDTRRLLAAVTLADVRRGGRFAK